MRDPEIRLHGRPYPAAFFVELLERLTRKRQDRPTFLQELTVAAKEVVRRDQEYDGGDVLRSGGDGEKRSGKGEPADPTLNAILRAEERAPEHDVVHDCAVKFCEHLIEADNHLRAAHSEWTRMNAYGRREGRESSLVECVNPKCGKEITGVGNDRARAGRCPRCATFRYRYGRDWTPNNAEGEDAA